MRFITLLGVFLFCVQNVAAINVICKYGYYYNSTSCVPCLSNCATCESDTNCTNCTKGFYGDLCETPCLENCSSGECHQQYGHCVDGCLDGQFPNNSQNGCVLCPENCDICRSMSYCFTCKDGFYGKNCSAMCPSECDRACNQSGNCLQCKEGYYKQADICLPCLPGCRTCYSSTNCSLCHETHVKAFLRKCIRRCSKISTNFVSNFDQRCGISLDKIMKNQSKCFGVNLKQSYKCITLRSCISCPSEDCSRIKNESNTCLSYESCSTECNPMDSSHIIRDGTTGQTLCEQTCSIYHAIEEEMCPLITENKVTSSEVIDCFQEPESTVNSSNDHTILITIAVVAACVVVILLVGKVACQHRNRVRSRLRSPEVALAEEPVQRSCGLTSQVQVNTTPLLPHRGEIPAGMYDTANCSTFAADNRAHEKSSVPLQRRGIPANMYDTANSSTFVADNRAHEKSSVPLQRRGIPADMYDTANCSTVVADNGAYTAYCNTAVTEDYINNTLVCPLQKSCVDNDDDNDEYDYVYFDQSAPADDTSQKLPP